MTASNGRVWLGAVLLAVAALVGCANRAAPLAGATPDGKDLVTASDESDGSKRARLRMELATGYFGRGQMSTALDEVKLAIQADPTQAQAFNLRGLIYANLGDDALAEASFRRALELNARDADTMQNYGYFLCQKKRYPEADALFDKALVVPQYRDKPRTLLTKGVCQAAAGQLPEAEASLMHAYEADPGSPAIAYNLADVLYRRAEYERARFYIRRINAVPALVGAPSLWLAARIERQLGDRQGAQELGEQLLHRFPDSSEAGRFERGNFDE